MSHGVDFHIEVKPISISFKCPHCGVLVEVSWHSVDVPETWGDDWGYVDCPNCSQEVKLGDFEYD
ncbi:MAG: hypothetical protein IKJ99_02990 [Oscillospiraceae bacterium]|nr:hypothetical protein [Oscillospiraceae bacterium]